MLVAAIVVILSLAPSSSAQEEADLAVFSNDIALSSLELRDGDNVTIYALVHNLGEDLGSATVEFYDTMPSFDDPFIGDDHVVVQPGGSSVASVDWLASEGDHGILVVISYPVLFDPNTTNNQALAEFHIFGKDDIIVYMEPTLIVSGGNVSIEYSTERVIPIRVQCLGQDVSDVTIVALQSSGFEIESITPRNMSAGEVSNFYLRIKAPPQGDLNDSEMQVVLIQARDENAVSNVAALYVTIHPPVAEVSWWANPLAATAVTGGAVGAALAAINATELGRYKFLCFILPLYTKLRKEEVLDHYVRGKIHGYVLANPGDHYSSIRKALDLTNSSLTYHLRVLEKEELIKSQRDGMYKRFYPIGAKFPDNGGPFTLVQQRIIGAITETPGICQKDIASTLGVSSSTVNYHIEKLIQQGIVEARRKGMRMTYYFVGEESVLTSPDIKRT
jgi:predicted transcriptional regulator